MIYNLMRCPQGLIDMLKDMYNNGKPEHSGNVFRLDL